MIKIMGRQSKEIVLDYPKTVGTILEELKVSEERFVFLVDGTPVTKDVLVTPDQELVFLEIFSGG